MKITDPLLDPCGTLTCLSIVPSLASVCPALVCWEEHYLLTCRHSFPVPLVGISAALLLLLASSFDLPLPIPDLVPKELILGKENL